MQFGRLGMYQSMSNYIIFSVVYWDQSLRMILQLESSILPAI